MIKPDRNFDLDHSVLNISAFILRQLSGFYKIKYDTLKLKVIDALGSRARENYPYALSFLFLLGRINYDERTDSFTANEIK